MNEPLNSLTALLSDVILPNLKVVQQRQAEQIAANDRLEMAIEEMHTHLEAQFAHLAAQLTACRAELAATQALLKTVQAQSAARPAHNSTLIH